MEMRLMEKTGHTEIKCSVKNYPRYATLIEAYLAKHGGQKQSENSRFIYFEVFADLLNGNARR